VVLRAQLKGTSLLNRLSFKSNLQRFALQQNDRVSENSDLDLRRVSARYVCRLAKWRLCVSSDLETIDKPEAFVNGSRLDDALFSADRRSSATKI